MSILSTIAIPVYGKAATQPYSGDTMQAISETFQVSGTANNRMVRGPKKGGRISIHFFNETASGASSTITVQYSNLPNPDPTNDNHWSGNDATFGSVVMTSTATATYFTIDKVFAEWVRFKPNVQTSAGKGWLWYRAEGDESQ